MSRPPTGQRKREIKALNPLHLEILRRVSQGQKLKDIAKALGVSAQTVSDVRCSRLGRQELDRLQRLETAATIAWFGRMPSGDVVDRAAEQMALNRFMERLPDSNPQKARWMVRQRMLEDVLISQTGV